MQQKLHSKPTAAAAVTSVFVRGVQCFRVVEMYFVRYLYYLGTAVGTVRAVVFGEALVFGSFQLLSQIVSLNGAKHVECFELQEVAFAYVLTVGSLPSDSV